MESRGTAVKLGRPKRVRNAADAVHDHDDDDDDDDNCDSDDECDGRVLHLCGRLLSAAG